MKPLGLSRHRLARDIGVPALRLARYFGTSPDLWFRFQAGYDLEVAQRQTGKRIEREVKAIHRVAG